MQVVEQLHFHCPVCNERNSTKTFPEHCFLKHNISTDQCSWCFGHCRPKNLKKHAVSCFRNFFKTLLSKIPPDTDQTFNLSPMSHSVPQESYPLPLVDLKHSNLRFQSDSLNVAVACVHTFLNSLESQWLHLKIRNSVWKSFIDAMKDVSVTMLPFSCSCVETNGTIHQHIIVKCAAEFKKIPRKGVRKEPILYPMELVETLDFISQSESTCNFSFDTLEKRLNHYNISMSLPQLHKIVLALQWNNGIVELYHKQYDSVNPSVLAPVAVLSGGLWVIPVKNLPGFEKHLILPVSKQFQPTVTETKSYLHLYQGKKMYFEEIDVCTEKEWVERQMEGGNVMHHVIGEMLYYPTLVQQRFLNLIKPHMISEEALEKSCIEKMTQMQVMEQSINKLKLTNLSLKRKYNASEKELKLLQSKHIKYLEQENEILRMKNLRKRVE